MIINTKFFGEIEIQDEDIIDFNDGLPGFEDIKKFVLIDAGSQGALKCLQSVEYREIAFIVANPWDVVSDYEMDIDDKQLEELGGTDINSLLAYCILNITNERITANLMAPVIINIYAKRGRQMVLYKSRFTTKHIIKEFTVKEV